MKDDGTFLPGLPFVPAADHFPLDQLQLWSTDGVSSPSSHWTFSWRQNIFISCFEQKHLSDTFGTPVLVDLLHTAAICYLATREPHVPCQISPSCGPTDAADEVKVTRYPMFFFFFICVSRRLRTIVTIYVYMHKFLRMPLNFVVQKFQISCSHGHWNILWSTFWYNNTRWQRGSHIIGNQAEVTSA